VYCSECIKDIKAKKHRNWTDIEIDLMVEYDSKIGSFLSTIELGENYRLMRVMDQAAQTAEKASLKLNTRFDLLKRT
jgi:dephospho-CoA kinase